ncbi:MAG: nucleoside phosphorylase [Pseudoalteromonas tetraodonis]|jgi:nucleoside phosphorylase
MISFLLALNSEAKPLVDFYRLKKTEQGPFAHFVSPDNSVEVELLVAGIGALSMAAGVAWLAGKSPMRNRVWLNLGVAGHADMALGQIALVHGSADSTQSRAHYPPQVAKWAQSTAACLSFNAPCTDYPGDALVDMEAHAFFNTAIKFSSSEIVQSLKVVSDNRDSNIEELNASKITGLISPHIETIVAYAKALQTLAMRDLVLYNKVEFPQFEWLDSLRATHSQRRQVTDLMRKAFVLDTLNDNVLKGLSACSHVSEVLSQLNELTRLAQPILPSQEVLGG